MSVPKLPIGRFLLIKLLLFCLDHNKILEFSIPPVAKTYLFPDKLIFLSKK